MGKAWMAREVSKSAILEDLYYETLWIIPEYLDNERSFVETLYL